MSISQSVCVLVLGLAVVGCSDDERRGGDAGPPPVIDGGGPAPDGGPVDGGSATPDTGTPVAFALTSSAFAEGEMIPTRHECGPPLATGPGDNVTPPLVWTPGPPETMSYAIVMRDIDAGRLVHWVLYDIPASTREVAEDVPSGYEPAFPAGSKQAELQSSGYFGYLGPCSPGRLNTYQLTLHALPAAALPGVDRATTENAAAAAVEAASIASATLTGES